MKWNIKWSDTAEKELNKIAKSNKKIAQQIVTRLDEIVGDPFAFTKKLRGFNLRKLRVGSYRVIVSLEQGKMIIFVVETGHRSVIYKKY